MNELINFDDVNTKIITIRNQNVIIDSDVAMLYGVQTKEVNQAIKNNPKKFPEGYIFALQSTERQELVKNFDRFKSAKHSISTNAFTEKGLYMLATILKSDRAIEATIAIVEAFAKLKELTNNLAILNSLDTEVIEPEIIESTIEKTGSLFDELFFSGTPTSAETSVELNLGLAKVKRSVKSESRDTITMQNKIDKLEQTIERMSRQLEKLTIG